MRKLMLPGLVLVVLAGVWLSTGPQAEFAAPETVQIPPGTFSYRAAGEFRADGLITTAPLEIRAEAAQLDIMKYQVTEADYARCSADGACADLGPVSSETLAQTGASFDDALAYAAWLSDKTGQIWRLPTDAEWVRAAGGRALQDLAPTLPDADPSRRWLATYRSEVAARGESDLARHAQGDFGTNELGVADLAGNVWEWTQSCQLNGTLSADGLRIAANTEYCGVRAVQGKHRSFVITFVRNPRSGGCAAGVPPDYLGIRLVHENTAALISTQP